MPQKKLHDLPIEDNIRANKDIKENEEVLLIDNKTDETFDYTKIKEIKKTQKPSIFNNNNIKKINKRIKKNKSKKNSTSKINNKTFSFRNKNKNKNTQILYSYKILKLKSLNSIYSNKLSCVFKAYYSNSKNQKKKNFIKKGAAIITKTGKLLGMLLMNTTHNYIFIPLESLYFLLKKFEAQKNFSQKKIKKISDLDFNMIPFGIAINSYKLDDDLFHKIIKPKIIKTEKMYKILIVNSINFFDENSFREDDSIFKVKPGDIVYKLNNRIVGNDLLLINRIIDEK